MAAARKRRELAHAAYRAGQALTAGLATGAYLHDDQGAALTLAAILTTSLLIGPGSNTIHERARDILIPWAGTVALRDLKQWRNARTLQDLCDLTARWLDGDLRTQPGYYGSRDVDEHLAPGLTRALVALNQAGVLTRTSQAGWVGPNYYGTPARACAAVEGFATPATVARIRAALHHGPYSIAAHPRARGLGGGWEGVHVTWRRDPDDADMRPCMTFGTFGRAREIRSRLQLGGAGRPAVEEAVDALQVVIWDGRPGRNTLWPDLLAALGHTPSLPTTVNAEATR